MAVKHSLRVSERFTREIGRDFLAVATAPCIHAPLESLVEPVIARLMRPDCAKLREARSNRMSV